MKITSIDPENTNSNDCVVVKTDTAPDPEVLKALRGMVPVEISEYAGGLRLTPKKQPIDADLIAKINEAIANAENAITEAEVRKQAEHQAVIANWCKKTGLGVH